MNTDRVMGLVALAAVSTAQRWDLGGGRRQNLAW